MNYKAEIKRGDGEGSWEVDYTEALNLRRQKAIKVLVVI